MCECIKELDRKGYVHRNMLKRGQYYLYRVNQYRKVTKDAPLLVQYCPECGQRIEE